MTRFMISLIFAVLTFGHVYLSAEANNNQTLNKKLPTVVVVGKVYCDTCFQQDFDQTSHFISGASVAVECRYGGSPKPIFREEAKTNKRGEFRVKLPFSVSKHAKRIQGCSVKLVRSSEPYCAVASTAARSSIRLKSRRRGTHVFSAGFFTFKPLNQPQLCSQKPVAPGSSSLLDTAEHNNNALSSFPPPLKDPATPTDVPPLPSLPIPNIPLPDLPNLPALPTLPRIPILPSIPPLVSSEPQAANDRTEKVRTQDLNFLPPNPNNPLLPPPALPSDQPPRLIPDVPLPHLPITLPPLPRLPSIPNLPPIITATQKTAVTPRTTKRGKKSGSHRRPRVEERQTFSFPPNPFQPPPLVPNPLQPSPPPLLPNPFQPTPPPLLPNPFRPPSPSTPSFPFPTIPGLTPSPPPPAFPFTIPPFPFPTPRGPGTPPA